jgi:hypothetical protein
LKYSITKVGTPINWPTSSSIGYQVT